MEDLRRIIGRNIVLLRAKSHLTQAEFAQQLHYTDKAVSKWERGDSVPDIAVLKQIADLFGVTVDYLLHEHEESEKLLLAEDVVTKRHNQLLISLIAVIGVWFLAVLAFAITYMATRILLWQVFVFAVPVSLIVALVFNSVWGRTRVNYLLISLLLWSILLALYLFLLSKNLWALFLIGIPGQICVILSSRIRRPRR
ncbi:MAG: helix-turn-helix transcriptional regulator [Oscillospiraceae bacterium]|nr:helix-turn-helix transcriptional regulator [Oscillospiraceae bacterium]